MWRAAVPRALRAGSSWMGGTLHPGVARAHVGGGAAHRGQAAVFQIGSTRWNHARRLRISLPTGRPAATFPGPLRHGPASRHKLAACAAK